MNNVSERTLAIQDTKKSCTLKDAACKEVAPTGIEPVYHA